MNKKEYIKCILEKLLKKYQRRTAKVRKVRVSLKPTEVYSKYTANNADIARKELVDEAAKELLELRFITADYLRFSTDIEKIYLREDQLDSIYAYLESVYEIVPQNVLHDKAGRLLAQYHAGGQLVQGYRENITVQLEDRRNVIDPQRLEANLKVLSFIEKNIEDLYVREVSMLVYGDSKWFEENNYDEICTVVRTILERPKEEYERNDAILLCYHIKPPEQEILIKGSWVIEWDDHILETANFRGGIAITSNDIVNIKRVSVLTLEMMTIENKTSYRRMNHIDRSTMYLGGYASQWQILFLKKVIQDNPDIVYYHFGDIDVGGFLIHRHLCRVTSMPFKLYKMGLEQLLDQRFRDCLQELTENDMSRIEALLEDERYCAVAGYMKAHRLKLEQEIISYFEDRDLQFQI